MKIIIDAMGGDYAPTEIIKGALMALQTMNISIILVGKTAQMLRVLRDQGCGELPKGLELANAEDVVDMHDDPVTVLKERRDSSMVVALNMLRDGLGDALISAGSTGALITASTLVIKRIHGIRRAAIAIEFPTVNGSALIADCGANAECTPEYLLQFAYMGAFYMQRLHDLEKPRVGLLNIGTEETKGLPLQRQTYELLRQADSAGRLSFVGNVEARDVELDVADVIVTDGYAGNILLKTAEGIARYMIDELRKAFSISLGSKLAYLLVRKGLRQLKTKMDYKEIGGSPLLGIAKPVIKAHGSSDARSICGAVRQAVRFVETGIISDIEANISLMRLAGGETANG